MDKLESKVEELIEVNKELAKQVKELKELMIRDNKKIGYVV